MPENINEQLNIADVNGGKNNEGGENSRPKFEISLDGPELSKAADHFSNLHSMVAGDQKIDVEILQKIREQILALQDKEREERFVLPDEIALRIEIAEKIMGKKDVFGPAAIEAAFGFRPKAKDIPPIQFDEAELQRAKELNQFLVLRTDTAPDGKPLTMEKMNEILAPKFEKDGKGSILYIIDYEKEDFYTGGKGEKPKSYSIPKLGWALSSKELIPHSNNRKNYLQQTAEIATYLENKVFKGQSMPKEYAEAIAEFNSEKARLEKLLSKGEKWEYEPEISKLKLNELTRQNPAEFLYDSLVYFQNNNERLVGSTGVLRVLTKTIDSGGSRVFFENYDDSAGLEGVRISALSDSRCDYDLGVLFSRKS